MIGRQFGILPSKPNWIVTETVVVLLRGDVVLSVGVAIVLHETAAVSNPGLWEGGVDPPSRFRFLLPLLDRRVSLALARIRPFTVLEENARD
jgi:hypothetical protein